MVRYTTWRLALNWNINLVDANTVSPRTMGRLGHCEIALVLSIFLHAEAHQRAVWLARTHQLGMNHASTLAAGRFLAEIQERSGRLDEAEALSREIKSRAESALGRQHPITLATAGTLAEILYNRGELGRSARYRKDDLHMSLLTELKRRNVFRVAISMSSAPG